MNIPYLDRLFRNAIRERDNYACQYPKCEKRFPRCLEVSHFFTRTYLSVRWDPLNCDLLCRACHLKLGAHLRKAYSEWKLEQLGETEYWRLIRRANSPARPSEEDVMRVIKELKEAA